MKKLSKIEIVYLIAPPITDNVSGLTGDIDNNLWFVEVMAFIL